MASITCPSCYATASYAYDKPQFCGKCGKNYVRGFVVDQEPRRPSIAKELRRMPREDEDYYDEPGDVHSNYFDPITAARDKSKWKRGLEGSFQIENESQKHKVTILDAVIQGGVERPVENKSAEQILAELQRENGSIKSAPIELRDTSNDVQRSVG